MKHETIQTNNKRGYLNEDFLFFHLKDRKSEQFDFHYHDFYKIIIFISGCVTYLIEGKAYHLKPWDILLVTDQDVHKAIIDTGETYERMVLWFNPNFLLKHSESDSNLLSCFETASKERQSLLRLEPENQHYGRYILSELEAAFKTSTFGSNTVKNSLFLLFIVHLNRMFLQTENTPHKTGISYDENISKVIGYINDSLSSNLSIERLSEKFFISKYTLMHNFKKQTGYTVHSFILQKRLLRAGALIKSGIPAMEASYECGFTDYSSFVRAFKKFYAVSPNKFKNL